MDPLTYDVAVVGGGMAGISIAAELAGEQSVALFEAEDQLGCHATGRSAAVYLPSYGRPLARVLTVASRPLFDELSEEGEVVLLKPRPLLVVAIDDTSEGLIRAWVEAAVGMDRVDPVDAIGLCPVLRPEVVRGGGLDAAGMDVDVSGLQEVYRRRLRRRGGTLHVSAQVSAITRVGWMEAGGTRAALHRRGAGGRGRCLGRSCRSDGGSDAVGTVAPATDCFREPPTRRLVPGRQGRLAVGSRRARQVVLQI